MKFRFTVASAAIAHLASASVLHGQRHASLHHHRGLNTKTEWETVTVTQYVTATQTGNPESSAQPWGWGDQHHHHHTEISVTTPSGQEASSASATIVDIASDSGSISLATPVTYATSVVTVSGSESPSLAIPVPYETSRDGDASTSSVSNVPISGYAGPSSSSASPSYSAPIFSSSSAHLPTYASSLVSSTASPNAPSASGISKGSLTPNGRKAGLSGFLGIATEAADAFDALAPYISWYSDYTPNTPDVKGVMGIPMLWGADGSACGDVTYQRINAFDTVVSEDSVPDIMFGFYEPDCYCEMSSEMSTEAGTSAWNSLLAPLAGNGTVLGSPSMCKQFNEDWLQPFIDGGLDVHWDVTSLHINKPDIDGVKEDVEYYLSTYKKPLWISEFACVDDENGFVACTDQGQINQFISDCVEFFEGNSSIVAYGPSNGEGLGTVWPLTASDGSLSETGQAYLNAIKDL